MNYWPLFGKSNQRPTVEETNAASIDSTTDHTCVFRGPSQSRIPCWPAEPSCRRCCFLSRPRGQKILQEWERINSRKKKRVKCAQNVLHATTPYPGRQILFHGGVFRGQSERVPPHRMNYLKKFTSSCITQLSQTNPCGRTYLVALKFPHSGHTVADGVHSDMTWCERIMQKVIARC